MFAVDFTVNEAVRPACNSIRSTRASVRHGFMESQVLQIILNNNSKCHVRSSSMFSAETRGILLAYCPALDMVHQFTGGQLLFLSVRLSVVSAVFKTMTSHTEEF